MKNPGDMNKPDGPVIHMFSLVCAALFALACAAVFAFLLWRGGLWFFHLLGGWGL